jgi:Lrp/AsnC family leucine-responsive transcriptional regulator
MTNAELADRVHLSPSACLRRVRRLEEEGVVVGYVMLVDPVAIGRGSTVYVEITLTSQSDEALEAFERAVAEHPEIMECHLMAGEADYLLRVAVGGTQDYERVHRHCVTRLPGVARARSSFVLRTVCRHTAHRL